MVRVIDEKFDSEIDVFQKELAIYKDVDNIMVFADFSDDFNFDFAYKDRLVKFMSEKEHSKYISLLGQLVSDSNGQIALEIARLIKRVAYSEIQEMYIDEPLSTIKSILKKSSYSFWINYAKYKRNIDATYIYWREKEDEGFGFVEDAYKILAEKHGCFKAAKRLAEKYEEKQQYISARHYEDYSESLKWYKKAKELGADVDNDIERIEALIEILITEKKEREIWKNLTVLEQRELVKNIDSLFKDVVRFVIKKQKVSHAQVQREFSVGYSRAARYIDFMERVGFISHEENVQGSWWKILITQKRFEDVFDEPFDKNV